MSPCSAKAKDESQYLFKISRTSSFTDTGECCWTPGPPILVSQQSKPQSLKSCAVLWTTKESVSGLSSVIPQPPPPAPVNLLWSPLASVTLQSVSRAGCPTPITFKWCWLMSMSSCKSLNTPVIQTCCTR